MAQRHGATTTRSPSGSARAGPPDAGLSDAHLPDAGLSDAGLSRRAFLAWLGVGAVGAATGAVGLVANTFRFGVEPVTVALPSLRAPVRVAWLCDLHYGPFIRANTVATWVDATLALSPDLIVLGGDMVDHRAPRDVAPLLAQLERLRAPLGTFAIRGNHEYHWSGDLERFEADLEGLGVEVLVNQGRMLRDDLHLAGVDNSQVGGRQMRQALAQHEPGSACLLASHPPDLLPRVPEAVDFTLMGHTHGGQVRIPGLPPLMPRSRFGLDAGLFHAPAFGYVSRGLGVTHLPVRINCPAELTLATLLPA